MLAIMHILCQTVTELVCRVFPLIPCKKPLTGKVCSICLSSGMLFPAVRKAVEVEIGL